MCQKKERLKRSWLYNMMDDNYLKATNKRIDEKSSKKRIQIFI